MTSTGPLGLVCGLGTAAVYGYGAFAGLRAYKDREEIVNITISKKPAAEVRQELEARYRVPKFFNTPAFKTASSALALGAGLSLFGTLGFFASTAAVAMIVGGGVNLVKSGLNLLGISSAKKLEAFSNKLKEKGAIPAAPAEDLSPAAKLDSTDASASFKTAANTNAPAAPEEKPAVKIQPPKEG